MAAGRFIFTASIQSRKFTGACRGKRWSDLRGDASLPLCDRRRNLDGVRVCLHYSYQLSANPRAMEVPRALDGCDGLPDASG